MTPRFSPVRLFAELLLIIAVAEPLVMLVLPFVVPGGGSGFADTVNVILLILLAGPFLYWRLLAAMERAKTAGRVQGSRGRSAGSDGAGISVAVILAAAAAAVYCARVAVPAGRATSRIHAAR